ncbi:MAG: hypothetical protein JO277_06410 [Candidatus Eremiobacteraeota bacterium]|nr:hypothetical protein [Candidatus Eremiobacteraeota bacterium]
MLPLQNGGDTAAGRMSPGVAGTSKLKVKPDRLDFDNVGDRFAQDVDVSDPGYKGKISEDLSDCKHIATLRPPFGKGPSYKVKVTPDRSGKCSVVFSDTDKHKASLSIAVTTPKPSPSPSVSPSPSPTPTPTPTPGPGTVNAAPGSVTICPSSGPASCGTHAQTVVLSQSNYSGGFGESDGCSSNVATVTSVNSTTYKVAGGSVPGTCIATFVGGAGKFATVTITVVGNVSANPASVAICPSSGSNACTPDTLNVVLSQPNYTGNFTESDTCTSDVATVVQVNSNTYTVAGQSKLGNCTATFTGILGKTVKVKIAIVNGVTINVRRW